MEIAWNDHRPADPAQFDNNLRDVRSLCNVTSSCREIRHPEKLIKGSKKIAYKPVRTRSEGYISIYK